MSGQPSPLQPFKIPKFSFRQPIANQSNETFRQNQQNIFQSHDQQQQLSRQSLNDEKSRIRVQPQYQHNQINQQRNQINQKDQQNNFSLQQQTQLISGNNIKTNTIQNKQKLKELSVSPHKKTERNDSNQAHKHNLGNQQQKIQPINRQPRIIINCITIGINSGKGSISQKQKTSTSVDNNMQPQNQSKIIQIIGENNVQKKLQEQPLQGIQTQEYELVRTDFSTVYYRCYSCQIQIESNFFQLKCLHCYHIECLQSNIENQIYSNNYCYVKCLCGIKIHQLILNQISPKYYQIILVKQIEVIKQQYAKQLQFCTCCQFFCIQDQVSNFFCPFCNQMFPMKIQKALTEPINHNSTYKTLNKNPIQDENNQLQKISEVCRGCKLITSEELINLSCLHFYHIHCLQQIIDDQLNNANLFRLECECRNSILQKIVRRVCENSLENLFQRQIQQIYSKYSHQLLKCKSCYFLCIKKRMNILLFCPNCSES